MEPYFFKPYLCSRDILESVHANSLELRLRKKNSSDREKLLKFEAEGREFSIFLQSLEEFIQTVKGEIEKHTGKVRKRKIFSEKCIFY